MKRLFLLPLLLLALSVKAQTVEGAEIYYKLLSSRKYLITAKVYRQCQDAPLNSLQGFVYADTFKIPMNFKRISIGKIKDTCGNPCKSTNFYSNFGFERHVYTDTVDFNDTPYSRIPAAGLCQVRFAVDDKVRSSRATTYNTTKRILYIDAGVNICLSFTEVQSPEFSVDPGFFAPANFAFNYCPGPLDTANYDSMAYELTDALEGPRDTVRYNKVSGVPYNNTTFISPYCPPNPGVINCRAIPAAKPPRGVYFDPNLCLVTTTPTNANEVGVLKFRVREFRKDQQGVMREIGYVCREMLVTVSSMPGNSPVYFSSVLSNLQVCPATQVCFSNLAKDDQNLPLQNQADTVKVTWNQALPGGTFAITDTTAREKNFTICWKSDPQKHKPGNYLLTIIAQDKACNINMVTKPVLVVLKKPSEYKVTKSVSSCGLLKYQINPINASQAYGSASLLDSTGKVIETRYTSNDSFLIDKDGKYYLRYQYYTNPSAVCYNTLVDTIVFNNSNPRPFKFAQTDTNVCNTYPFTLKFNPSKYKNILSWDWQLNGVSVNSTDSIYSGTVSFSTKLKLVVRLNDGCYTLGERNFNGYILGKNIFNNDSFGYCNAQQIVPRFDSTGFRSPYTSTWTTSRGVVVNRLNEQAFQNPLEGEKLYLKVVDNNHCTVTDSATFFRLFDNNRLTLKINKPVVCMDTITNVLTTSIAKNNVSSLKWNINGKDSATTTVLQIPRKFNTNTKVRLTIQTRYNCSQVDSIDIVPVANPKITLPVDTVLCTFKTYDIVPKLSGTNANTSFDWYLNGELSSQHGTVYKANLSKPSRLKVIIKNSAYCAFEDSMNFWTYPGVKMKIIGDTAYNRFEKIYLKTDTTYSRYFWITGDTTRNTEFFAVQLGAPGKHFVWCEVENEIGCTGRDTLWFRTDANQSVQSLKVSNIKIYPNPTTDVLNIQTEADLKAEIYDAGGKLVREVNLVSGVNHLDVSAYNSGNYVLKIGDTSFRFKVVR